MKTKIAKEYLSKFPDSPTASLAQKMYKENKKVFDNVEQARNTLRYHRGAMGSKNRVNLKDDTHKKPLKFSEANLYGLPKSYAEKRQPLVLPKANNEIVVVSDFHVPYHDIPAIECFLNYAKDNRNKINTVILNGDILDFHDLSKYEKDPRARTTREEFDTCRALLECIRKALPKADIYWTMGNHDERYEVWLYKKAPEIFDDPYFKLEERLRLNELRIKIVDSLTMIMAGKLYIAHGHKWQNGAFGGSPVNAARGLYMKLKKSAIMGHVHNVSQHSEKDIAGVITSCWSTGCMSELRPAYNAFCNKYQHGFAHVSVSPNRNFTVKNMMIIDGKIH